VERNKEGMASEGQGRGRCRSGEEVHSIQEGRRRIQCLAPGEEPDNELKTKRHAGAEKSAMCGACMENETNRQGQAEKAEAQGVITEGRQNPARRRQAHVRAVCSSAPGI